MSVSAFIKSHSEQKQNQLITFLETVFHTLDGEDGDNDHIFHTKHSEPPTADSPWPYTPFENILDGSENATYHICTSTFRKSDEGRINRKSQNFNSLHMLVLDDIGTKVEPNKLKPSFIIETSKDNYQWGYIFSSPITDRNVATALVRAVYSRRDLTDQGGKLINKLVKLPLGKNLKEGRDNFEVRLVELNKEVHYTPSELIAAWSLNLGTQAAAQIRREGGEVPLVDEVLTFLQESDGLYGKESDEYYKVLCPRGGDHSDGKPYAGYSPLGHGEEPRKRHFKCFHEHDGDAPDTHEFLAVVGLEGGPQVGLEAPTEHFENEDGFIPLTDTISPEHFPEIRFREDKPPLVLKTQDNVTYLLNRYGFECYYDVISKKNTITHTDLKHQKDADNYNDAILYRIYSQFALNEINIGKDILFGYIQGVTIDNARNPVVEWLQELDPDFEIPAYKALVGKKTPEKVNFVKMLSDTVTLVDEKDRVLWELFLRLFLLQCVSAADHGKQSTHAYAKKKWESVLVLVGRQGAQKTKWLAALAAAMPEYFADGKILNPDNKDSVKEAVSYWICELGELDATMRKADIAHMKGFLSKSVDEIRLPYGRTTLEFKRRTSFCASVNDTGFLHDSTGNRRFWPVEVDYLKMPSRELVDCVWWQVWREYLEGAQWWVDSEDQIDVIARRTADFDSANETPEIMAILSHFGPLNIEVMTNKNTEWLTSREVCIAAGLDPERLTLSKLKKVSGFITNQVKSAEVKRIKKKANGNQVLYRMPKINQKFRS